MFTKASKNRFKHKIITFYVAIFTSAKCCHKLVTLNAEKNVCMLHFKFLCLSSFGHTHVVYLCTYDMG